MRDGWDGLNRADVRRRVIPGPRGRCLRLLRRAGRVRRQGGSGAAHRGAGPIRYLLKALMTSIRRALFTVCRLERCGRLGPRGGAHALHDPARQRHSRRRRGSQSASAERRDESPLHVQGQRPRSGGGRRIHARARRHVPHVQDHGALDVRLAGERAVLAHGHGCRVAHRIGSGADHGDGQCALRASQRQLSREHDGGGQRPRAAHRQRAAAAARGHAAHADRRVARREAWAPTFAACRSSRSPVSACSPSSSGPPGPDRHGAPSPSSSPASSSGSKRAGSSRAAPDAGISRLRKAGS